LDIGPLEGLIFSIVKPTQGCMLMASPDTHALNPGLKAAYLGPGG